MAACRRPGLPSWPLLSRNNNGWPVDTRGHDGRARKDSIERTAVISCGLAAVTAAVTAADTASDRLDDEELAQAEETDGSDCVR